MRWNKTGAEAGHGPALRMPFSLPLPTAAAFAVATGQPSRAWRRDHLVTRMVKTGADSRFVSRCAIPIDAPTIRIHPMSHIAPVVVAPAILASDRPKIKTYVRSDVRPGWKFVTESSVSIVYVHTIRTTTQLVTETEVRLFRSILAHSRQPIPSRRPRRRETPAA